MSRLRETDQGTYASVASQGAERARAALSMLLQREMMVVRSQVSSIDVADGERLQVFREQLLVDDDGEIGRLGIQGPPDGSAWVGFPGGSAQQIAAVFGIDDSHSEESRSMIAEIANIVTGSYLTELGDTWGVTLDPTPAALNVPSHELHADFDAIDPDDEDSRVIALGYGFADDGGSYDVSVLLLLHEQGASGISGAQEG